jgi:hypothetical protein
VSTGGQGWCWWIPLGKNSQAVSGEGPVDSLTGIIDTSDLGSPENGEIWILENGRCVTQQTESAFCARLLLFVARGVARCADPVCACTLVLTWPPCVIAALSRGASLGTQHGSGGVDLSSPKGLRLAGTPRWRTRASTSLSIRRSLSLVCRETPSSSHPRTRQPRPRPSSVGTPSPRHSLGRLSSRSSKVGLLRVSSCFVGHLLTGTIICRPSTDLDNADHLRSLPGQLALLLSKVQSVPAYLAKEGKGPYKRKEVIQRSVGSQG